MGKRQCGNLPEDLAQGRCRFRDWRARRQGDRRIPQPLVALGRGRRRPAPGRSLAGRVALGRRPDAHRGGCRLAPRGPLDLTPPTLRLEDPAPVTASPATLRSPRSSPTRSRPSLPGCQSSFSSRNGRPGEGFRGGKTQVPDTRVRGPSCRFFPTRKLHFSRQTDAQPASTMNCSPRPKRSRHGRCPRSGVLAILR